MDASSFPDVGSAAESLAKINQLDLSCAGFKQKALFFCALQAEQPLFDALLQKILAAA
jgi:hypothetical protein